MAACVLPQRLPCCFYFPARPCPFPGVHLRHFSRAAGGPYAAVAGMRFVPNGVPGVRAGAYTRRWYARARRLLPVSAL